MLKKRPFKIFYHMLFIKVSKKSKKVLYNFKK